ncbi:putative transposon Tn552 DNA-invertase bin3 [compost metagenome]
MPPFNPLVRAYLRVSTPEQDVERSRQLLKAFAEQHGQFIAGFYLENESGTKLHRPELFRLLDDSLPGDFLLCEQVDRLSRLNFADWQTLRAIIQAKGVHIIALDLPISHRLMASEEVDTFTHRMLSALNLMMLDMLAAVARKDYDDRRRRSLEGIKKAQAEGKYKGRKRNTALHARIKFCLDAGMSYRQVAMVCGCSKTTVQHAKRLLTLEGEL